MIKHKNFHPDSSVDSILIVRASGSIQDDIAKDLIQEEGKSIAQLINDQEKPKT
jgi:hypothetical protein